MKKEEHICARMVRVIEENGLSIAEWEEKANSEGIKVTGGYLRKSAKNNIAVGHKLIEYFLAQFPEVNANWLITGENINAPTNAIAWLQPLAVLQKDMDLLRGEAENLKQRIEAIERNGRVMAEKA